MKSLIKQFRNKFHGDLLNELRSISSQQLDVVNGLKAIESQQLWKIYNEASKKHNGGLTLPKSIMQNCKLLPSRNDALPLIAELLMGGSGIVAEVGVAYGDFSRAIINTLKPSKFYSIDLFNNGPGREFWGYKHFEETNLGQKEYIEQKFKQEINAGSFFLRQGFSWEVLETFEDSYFDYIYLDAAHDYENVKKDIQVIIHKIKNGGIVQFNDYTSIAPGEIPWDSCYYGVRRAVDELLINGKHEILFFCLEPAGYNDLVIRMTT